MALAIPPELFDEFKRDNVVLFLGAGVSGGSLPGWGGLLEEMIVLGKLGKNAARDLRRLLKENNYLVAAQAIRAELGANDYRIILTGMLGAETVKPNARHEMIAGLKPQILITTNFDTLIERLFDDPIVVTPRDHFEMNDTSRKSSTRILKLHGDIHKAETLIFTKSDYSHLIHGDIGTRNVLIRIFANHTVLFVGCSLTDPDILHLLDSLSVASNGCGKRHYALVDIAKMNPYVRKDLKDSYNIEAFGGDLAGKYPDIDELLRELQKAKLACATPLPDTKDIRGLLEAAGYTVASGAPSPVHLEFHCTRAQRNQTETVGVRYLPDGDRLMFDDARGELTVAAFLDQLVDALRPYAQRIRTEYEKDGIRGLAVELEVQDKPDSAIEDRAPLQRRLEAFLNDRQINLLTLLGDFGSGKSWLCRKLVAEPIGSRIPLLVRLEQYQDKEGIWEFLARMVKSTVHTLQRLNKEGRLLLILDGFDEMTRAAGEYKYAVDDFNRIQNLVNGAPLAKVLVTCRTAYFKKQEEEDKILRGARHTGAAIELNKSSQAVYLSLFERPQILAALKGRHKDGDSLCGRLEQIESVWNLARRPILLDMIAENINRLKDIGDLNLATLYASNHQRLLERRKQTIDVPLHDSIIEDLAWHLQSRPNQSIPVKELGAWLKRILKADEDFQRIEEAVRTDGFLGRDSEGNYEFGHPSLREFPVARRLAGLLKDGKAKSMRLSDAILRFVYAMLAVEPIYRIEERDGMVLVPKGPFLYGDGEEACVDDSIVDDFWFDRHPVTNEQFLQFLKKHGKKEEWLDHDASEIKKGLKLKPEFKNHPVTGVSWFGATAFAEAAGKQLPTEQQWEKAARGIDGRVYPWGEAFDSARCNTRESGRNSTSIVGEIGEKGRSPFGAEDMAGNVFEWTSSKYQPDRDWCVVRGGSWYNARRGAACAYRDYAPPGNRGYKLGFRCSRTKT